MGSVGKLLISEALFLGEFLLVCERARLSEDFVSEDAICSFCTAANPFEACCPLVTIGI